MSHTLQRAKTILVNENGTCASSTVWYLRSWERLRCRLHETRPAHVVEPWKDNHDVELTTLKPLGPMQGYVPPPSSTLGNSSERGKQPEELIQLSSRMH